MGSLGVVNVADCVEPSAKVNRTVYFLLGVRCVVAVNSNFVKSDWG